VTQPRLPDFVILGAQKAGSTSLHEALRRHASVYMPRFETPFFEDPFYDAGKLDNLAALLSGAGPDRLVGIKRPDYLGRPECPARLAQHIPNARLIAVLRDPVARAISAYFWYMQVGIIPVAPPNQGLAALLDGRLQAQYPKADEILNYGLYGRQLERYLSHFAPQQLKVVTSDALREQPSRVLGEICDFLGIEEDAMNTVATQRVAKPSVYGSVRLRWLALANRLFFYDYSQDDSGRVVLAQKQSRVARIAFYGMIAVDRWGLARLFSAEKPALNPALRQQLRDWYAEDGRKLAQLLPALPPWLSPASVVHS
jgi:hypothetical protein